MNDVYQGREWGNCYMAMYNLVKQVSKKLGMVAHI